MFPSIFNDGWGDKIIHMKDITTQFITESRKLYEE